METSEYLARARALAYKMERAASDEQRVQVLKGFLSSPDNIPAAVKAEIKQDLKDEIKEDLIEDIKSGDESDAYDEIRDELREEIESELAEESEKQNAWVFVRDKAIDYAIQNAITSLTLLVEIVRTNNSISSTDGVISPIQREQILAVLKAVIAELEAPYIDKGRISKLRDWLFGIGKRAVERKLSSEITEGFDKAQSGLGEILDKTQNFDTGAPF